MTLVELIQHAQSNWFRSKGYRISIIYKQKSILITVLPRNQATNEDKQFTNEQWHPATTSTNKMESSFRKSTTSSRKHSRRSEKWVASVWFLSIGWNRFNNVRNKALFDMSEKRECCYCRLASRLIWNETIFQRVLTILYFHARRLHSLVKRILQSGYFTDLKKLVVDKARLEKRWDVTSVAPLIFGCGRC